MKIKISEIEKNIPYKLKKNYKVVGLDTAQVTGIAILKTDKEFLHIEPLVLSFKTKNHKEIYATMVKTFERLIEEDQFAVIEEVFVGFSRAGSVELAKYGAFCIAECIKKGIDYETISATSARAKFKIDIKSCGKGKTKEAVGKWIKDNLGIEFTDNNLNDAVVLGLCGMCDGLDWRSQAEIKKGKK